MLLDILIFILTLILIAGFATGFVIFYFKYKGAESVAIRKTLETALVQNQLKLEIEKRAAEEIGNNDGFIKFLSDSRDWAFDYIEKVQESIKNLKTAVDANDETAVKKAHQDLINLLPEEENK